MPKHSKAKQYRYESESEDEDLEGGFLKALLSGAIRLGTRAAPKAAQTVARAGPKVIGRVPASASRLVSNPLRATTRAVSRIAQKPAVSRLSSLAGVGLTFGVPIWQALDYNKQRGVMAEEAQRIAEENANAQAQAYFDAQDVETQKYLDDVEKQRKFYEEEVKAIKDQRLRDEEEYKKLVESEAARVKKEEEEYKKMLEAEAARIKRDEEDYKRVVEEQQRYMEEQIAAQVQDLIQYYAPPPPVYQAPKTTQPVAQKPVAQKPVAQQPVAQQPVQTGAPQRLTKRGRGKAPVKVDRRKVRAEIVKKVMREMGFKRLADASRYVKEHNLY